MSQTRTKSAMETGANVAIGYVIAVITAMIAFPLFGIEVPVGSQMALNVIFTVVSIIRSYTLRRLFNAWR